MKVLVGRNVCELYVDGLRYLNSNGERSGSRNGPVMVSTVPVTSVYECPTERVLFDAKRDANPFFHLFECLWMLNGRNDAQVLDRYVKDFSSRYSDDGVIHGAYGHRWRTALGFDQLDEVVRRLRADLNDRQAVIQMWDGRDQESSTYDSRNDCEGDTLLIGSNDLCGKWKDRPCNTHVYLRVRDVGMATPQALIDDPTTISQETYDQISRGTRLLDLTVLCRSNDVVWGAYGANAVHFSFLQEYLAGRIGCGVGRMYQVSNNFHGYVSTLDPLGDPYDLDYVDPYGDGEVHAQSIGTDFGQWDEDLRKFMEWHDGDVLVNDPPDFDNRWFYDVAAYMCTANALRRAGDWDAAAGIAAFVTATDWRMAALAWLERHRPGIK